MFYFNITSISKYVLLWGIGCLFLSTSFAVADIDCDGVDDFTQTSIALSDVQSATTGTIIVWFNPTGTQADETCGFTVTPAIVGNSGSWIGIHRLGSTTAAVYGYDNDYRCSNITIESGTWTVVTWRLSGGTLTGYKDGTSTGTVGLGTIGDITGAPHVCGKIDRAQVAARVAAVRWYASALSDDEIAAISRSNSITIGRTQPTAHWTFNQCGDGVSGDGVVFGDRSGNGRTITGNDGANNTGLTCRASNVLRHGGGVQ